MKFDVISLLILSIFVHNVNAIHSIFGRFRNCNLRGGTSSASGDTPDRSMQIQTSSSADTNISSSTQQTISHSKDILGRAVLTMPHRRMPVVRIAPGLNPPLSSPSHPGTFMVATPAYVTKFSLCESLGCALRDLRVIDQFNGRYSGPAFLARSNCVIVNVGHVRAIVMRDQVLIFLPEASSNVNSGFVAQNLEQQDSNLASVIVNKKSSHVQETIEHLVDALVTYLNSIYHSSHNLVYDDEGHETHLKSKGDTFGGQSWRWMSSASQDKAKRVKHDQRVIHEPIGQAPPFELVVIEALLGHVCSYESSKVSKLIVNAQSVLDDITCNKDIGTKRSQKKDAFLEMQIKLGELLPLKNKIDSLEAKCTEVSAAIEEVLKNDEDMAAMRLSAIEAGKGVLEGDPDNLHVEVELLFEDYLLQMDEVLLSLRSMQNTVRNTEEVVEIELDLLRNRIMRYEMLIELSGLVVGVAAAVTGGFGMNLLSGLEEHPTMFWDVAKGLCIIMVALAWGILRKLSSDNIL